MLLPSVHHRHRRWVALCGVMAVSLVLPAGTGGSISAAGDPGDRKAGRQAQAPSGRSTTLPAALAADPAELEILYLGTTSANDRSNWVQLAAAPTGKAARGKAVRVAQAPSNGSRAAGNGNGANGRKIRLDFRDVDIDNVLKFFSMAAGLTLVKDAGLTGPVTVLFPEPVSLEEGFRVLEMVLNTKGYTLQRESTIMRVQQRRGFEGGERGGRGGGGFGGAFGGGGFRDRGPQITVFKLESASAQQVARIVNDLFRTTGGGGPGGFRGGRGGGRGREAMLEVQQQQSENPLAALAAANTVRASADDYTNSVAVLAPNNMLDQIRTLIQQLDQKVDQSVSTRVFRLENSYAEEMAPLVSNVLLGAAPAGAAGGALQNVPWEQRVRLSARIGSTGATAGQVVPDVRTNSLVVSTTEANMAVVEQIIKELDSPVRQEPNTFVVRLENARANDLATLMNQAFNTTGRGLGFGGLGAFGQGFGGNFGNRGGFGNQGNFGNRGGNFGNRGGFGNQGGFGNRGGFGGNRPGVNRRSAAPEEEDGFRLAAAQYPGPEDELLPEEELDETFESAQLPGPRTGVRATSPYQRGGVTRGLGGFGGIGGFGTFGQNMPVMVVPDTNSNSLIINADPQNMAMIRELIRSLDVVSEQVLIEALIVEASLDRSTKLGIDWTWTHSLGGDTTGEARQQSGLGALTSGFRYSIMGQNIEAVLNALATDQRFNILATPRIFTSNNQPAEINIGQQVPYIISTRETEQGTQTFNYGYMDVGIILNVVPRIAQSGLVTMDVQQAANELQGFTSFNAPIVAQRTTDTQVSVADGQTVIIGGIIRDTETKRVNKVPILGDIPLIGNLFRSTDKTKNKTELMVFLTPRIVHNPGQAALLTEQQKAQLRTPVPPSPGPLPAVDPTPPKTETPPAEGGTRPSP